MPLLTSAKGGASASARYSHRTMIDELRARTKALYEEDYASVEAPSDDASLYAAILDAAASGVDEFVDLGAGSGGLLEALLTRTPGTRVVAVEPAISGCIAALQRLRHRESAAEVAVHASTIARYLHRTTPVPNRTFLMCRVTSHLDEEDLVELLQHLRVHLAQGSTLLIADRAWRTSDWTGRWQAFFAEFHTKLPLGTVASAADAQAWWARGLPTATVELAARVPAEAAAPEGYVLRCQAAVGTHRR